MLSFKKTWERRRQDDTGAVRRAQSRPEKMKLFLDAGVIFTAACIAQGLSWAMFRFGRILEGVKIVTPTDALAAIG
jgi:hypothetical protein